MRRISLAVYLACLGLLAYGLVAERHEVMSLEGNALRSDNGLAFTANATVDGYVLQDGRLTDSWSLVSGNAVTKDCKT